MAVVLYELKSSLEHKTLGTLYGISSVLTLHAEKEIKDWGEATITFKGWE